MGYIGKQPAKVPLTSSDITDNIITSAKIANGAITGDDISSTFNISSKTVTLPSASVTAHATDFDDNKIVNDLSTLGLRVHAQENLIASNTNSASFDTFQDSSAVTGLTNAVRASEEFMFAGTEGSPTEYDYDGASTKAKVKFYGMNSGNGTWYEIDDDGDTARTDTKHVIPSISIAVNGGGFPNYTSGNTSAYALYDFGSQMTFGKGKYQIGKINTWGDVKDFKFEYSLDNVSWTPVDLSNATQESKTQSPDHDGGSTTSSGDFSNGAIDGTGRFAQLHTNKIYLSLIQLENIPSITARYFKLSSTSFWSGTSNSNAGWGTFAPIVPSYTTNATGSFEGNAITASSTNKMGAVITYQDNGSSNNVLNTDIILKLSADNGSNYSTATLTALPDFSTGIKMAKVNDLSVTAGTSLKYKIEFANQASGSKEARIRGVSLQY